jgi:hypothetical protein
MGEDRNAAASKSQDTNAAVVAVRDGTGGGCGPPQRGAVTIVGLCSWDGPVCVAWRRRAAQSAEVGEVGRDHSRGGVLDPPRCDSVGGGRRGGSRSQSGGGGAVSGKGKRRRLSHSIHHGRGFVRCQFMR